MVQFLESKYWFCLTWDLGKLLCQYPPLQQNEVFQLKLDKQISIWHYSTAVIYEGPNQTIIKYLQICESAHWDAIQLIFPGQNDMSPSTESKQTHHTLMKQ